MSAKHTPGPWFLDDAIDVDLPNHIGISSDKHGLLAQVVWKMEDDERTPECEANARLIAAAPELLEFVKEWLDRQGSDENYMTAKARAAIAKATK